jgi:uridine kinase
MVSRFPFDEAMRWLGPHLTCQFLRDDPRDGKKYVVGVAGPSASGKGTLIKKMADSVGCGVTILELDRYYHGIDVMKARGVDSFDDPAALELDLAAEHLKAMKRGDRHVDVPIYDFPSGLRTGADRISVWSLIVVDGLFALRPPIVDLLDLKIFIETDPHSALLRRLFRDAGVRGRTKQSSRDVIRMFFEKVLPAQRAFVDPSAEAADVIVESNYQPKRESRRAGAKEHQFKFPGTVSEVVLRDAGAQRLAYTRQTDTYLAPKVGALEGETIRLRAEGDRVFLAYKGPLNRTRDGRTRGRYKREVEIGPEDAARFGDIYAPSATLTKERMLYAWKGDQIAVDRVDGLGDFVEVRTRTADIRRVLDRYGRFGHSIDLRVTLGEMTSGYYDLWRKKRQTAR